MQINNKNFRQHSFDEILESIKNGTFTLQTVGFEPEFLNKMLCESMKRNSALEESHRLLFDEVKALRVALNDLQNIAGHPDPIPVNEVDEAHANDHINKRFADDNAEAEAKEKRVQEEKQKLIDQAAEKKEKATQARAKVAQLLNEQDATLQEKQQAIEVAKKEAEQAECEIANINSKLESGDFASDKKAEGHAESKQSTPLQRAALIYSKNK